jgi:hypothetical protein
MKKGIQQCKIQWNAIPNKGALANRICKFEQNVIVLSFFRFFWKLRGLHLTFIRQKKRQEERNQTV